MACHSSYIRWRTYYDTRQRRRVDRSRRCPVVAWLGTGLCALYRHHQPRQAYCRHIQLTAHLLRLDSRRNSISWEDSPLQHGYHGRHRGWGGMAQSYRPGVAADSRLHSIPCHSYTQHRCNKSVSAGRVRAHYGNPCRNSDVRRATHHKHHARHLHSNYGSHIYDFSNKEIETAE